MLEPEKQKEVNEILDGMAELNKLQLKNFEKVHDVFLKTYHAATYSYSVKIDEYMYIVVDYILGFVLSLIITLFSKLSIVLSNWVYPQGHMIVDIIGYAETITIICIYAYLVLGIALDFMGRIVLKWDHIHLSRQRQERQFTEGAQDEEAD